MEKTQITNVTRLDLHGVPLHISWPFDVEKHQRNRHNLTNR